jgi:ribosome maturation factor RimP
VNEIEDAGPLSFFIKGMNKEQIIQAVETAVKERGCFLVEVTVSAENDIEIVIEKEEGIVDWEDCAAIDKVMHEAFDQDVEDYALTVSSAGLDRPFKVLRQYQKAIGSQVDVKFKGGKRILATLTSAGEDSIGLQYTALEAVEGKKKKEKVEHNETFPLSEINSTSCPALFAPSANCSANAWLFDPGRREVDNTTTFIYAIYFRFLLKNSANLSHGIIFLGSPLPAGSV